jgi:HlyD family secretion protein
MNTRKKNSIFRKESMERLSSPEQLDRLMKVIDRRDWLPLSTLGVFVAGGLLWSIVGKIPVNLTSEGILLRPGRVVELQSPIQGQLAELKVQVGDCIEKKDVIGTIDPSLLREKIKQENQKLAKLKAQDREVGQLQQQSARLEILAIQQQQFAKSQRLQTAIDSSQAIQERELEAIAQERASIEQRLQTAGNLSTILSEQELTALDQQQISLQKELETAQTLAPGLKDRLEKRRLLSEQGGISSDQLFQAEQEYRQTVQQVFRLKAQLKQLDLQKSESRQKYLTNLNNISQDRARLKALQVREFESRQKYRDTLSTSSGLKAEIQELDTREKRLEQQNHEASNQRTNQIQDIQANIAELSRQYRDNLQIESPYSGCILELTTTNGSVLSPGSRLGSIQLSGSSPIENVSYFPVGQGKRIKPGMKIYITPSNVRREQYGGIVGTVTKVSAFPITKEGAANLVGNAQLVDSLIAKVGPVIEVRSQLQLDALTPSGYHWSSSQGPDKFTISPGTTTSARVTVEEEAPIALVLPILKEWTGIYSIAFHSQ